MNVDRVESLVYVHYNLRLLSHYCEVTKNDRTFLTWDNNLEKANVEDELLGDHEGDPIHTLEMPPPTISRFLDAGVLPLASQRPTICGGNATNYVP